MANFKEWRQQYPAEVTLEMRNLRGHGNLWVVEGVGRYDGGPGQPAVDILEFRGDKAARETIYVTEAWDAPEWRARWRAAPESAVLRPAGSGACGRDRQTGHHSRMGKLVRETLNGHDQLAEWSEARPESYEAAVEVFERELAAGYSAVRADGPHHEGVTELPRDAELVILKTARGGG